MKGLTEDFLRNNVVRFGGLEPVKGTKNQVNVAREEEIKKEDDVPPKKAAPKKEDLKKIDDLKQELNNVQHSEEEKALPVKTKIHALKGLFNDKIPMEFLCLITQEKH